MFPINTQGTMRFGLQSMQLNEHLDRPVYAADTVDRWAGLDRLAPLDSVIGGLFYFKGLTEPNTALKKVGRRSPGCRRQAGMQHGTVPTGVVTVGAFFFRRFRGFETANH